MPKKRIEEAAALRQAKMDRAEQVIVGVNKYVREDEQEVDVLSIDNKAVRESQIARLNKIKAERDEAACAAALDALKVGARSEQVNLLALAVEATRARATTSFLSMLARYSRATSSLACASAGFCINAGFWAAYPGKACGVTTITGGAATGLCGTLC
jgi:methylmalonyl-CoA mutase N-terminal domain/subunit